LLNSPIYYLHLIVNGFTESLSLMVSINDQANQ